MASVIPVVTAMIAIILAILYLNSGPKFDPASMRGMRVLITGASSVLGEELACQYAQLGAKLLLTDFQEAPLKNLAEKCRDMGAPPVMVVAGNMADGSHRIRLKNEVEKHLGGLDYLVLNHADYSAQSWLGSAQNLSDLDRTMNANFLSYVDMTSNMLPSMRRGGGIGIVSSLAAKVPVPLLTLYSASTAALWSFFSALRQELHHDRSSVSITTFLLGAIATDEYTGIIARNFPAIHSYFAASPQDAAQTIICDIATRETEVVYPLFARFQYYLHLIIPEIYEYNFHHFSKNNIIN